MKQCRMFYISGNTVHLGFSNNGQMLACVHHFLPNRTLEKILNHNETGLNLSFPTKPFKTFNN